jgi:hypothetical protein
VYNSFTLACYFKDAMLYRCSDTREHCFGNDSTFQMEHASFCRLSNQKS